MLKILVIIIFFNIVQINYGIEKFHQIEEQENPLDKIKSKFTRDWETKLNDFNPEHFYTFEIPKRRKLTWYENVQNVPAEIQGAFMTSENERQKIYFIVRLEENQSVYYTETTNEAVFKFKLPRKGLYSFTFDNRYNNEDMTVTVTIGTNQHQILGQSELDKTHDKILKLNTFMKNVYVDEEFMRNNYKERVKSKFFI